MARQKNLRKVVAPPNFNSFKPHGARATSNECVELLYEEYEAIKLTDYDLMKHDEAAKLMGISRPTFARIYESARRNIAKALVETREIKAVYGNAIMDKSWSVCKRCSVRFTIPKSANNNVCPLCSSSNIELVNK